ncbi:SDR family NAD(P)-dependent oxidoreductase [Actinomadura yumaensis]|uniref:SDR family NAD(P)-dependent oxidoreductase n=1 Tax=Actinomadura yumaensis TaxID=111807 RepID=UPI00360FD436
MTAAVDGTPLPDTVLAVCTASGAAGPVEERLHAVTSGVLALLQEWPSDESTSRLVVVTRGAVATGPGDGVDDLPAAAVWGLVRSAQSENPGRIVLLDLDGPDASSHAVPAALASGEPQIALRDGRAYAPRLVRYDPGDRLSPPPGAEAWRLVYGADGEAALVPDPEHGRPLAPGEVRVALRAVAVSAQAAGPGAPDEVRDVRGDGAGVVAGVGADVDGFAVGDRVMGAFDAVGPVALTDHRLVVPMPAGWSYAEAAGAVSTYLPAYHPTPADLDGTGRGEGGRVERVRSTLSDLAALFEDGTLPPAPVTVRDVYDVREALRRADGAAGRTVLSLPPPLDPDGTVLITGGTGALGAATARHLVAERGVRRLLLASRRGPEAPGADALAAELAALGAEVAVAACDTGDRAALADLLASVPARHPLTAVVHTAGIVQDATIRTATPDQLDAVLRVKADGAWHLHELTRDLNLAALVLFSSVTGLAGGPGQGSYSAANVFLDALAQHRHARGLPATSLAWGFWEMDTGMSGRFTDIDLARNARSGDLGLSAERALALFDAALGLGRPLLAPVRLDLPGLRRRTAGARSRRSCGSCCGAPRRGRAGRRPGRRWRGRWPR